MKLRTVLALSAAIAGLYAIVRNQKKKTAISPKEELERSMEQFLSDDRFALFIQPVVELSTGRIAGGEILARLDHPEQGMILPGVFLPIINRLELQKPFDLHIFRKSCAWLSGTEGLDSISVNFSRRTLSDPTIVQVLTDIADHYALAHERLVIEITEWEKESDVGSYRDTLTRLREKGFRIYLDDFGSGVTSFADLNQFSMDIVKIDRSILLAAGSADGRIILQALTDMASAMGVDVVCEGIETEEEERLALSCGCRYGQGFRYCGAVGTDAFVNMLSEGSVCAD